MMDNYGCSSEDQDVDKDAYNKSHAQEISFRNKNSICIWTNGHVYYSLA